MQTEDQCKPSQRFLFADEYFSDKAITIWQSECIKRCKDKPKGQAYEKYIKWIRKENEIAVFTLYAYADFEIPKKFDIIFHLDNPKDFIKIDYELTQSIHEAWFPLNTVDAGHKHLCVFTFDKTIPKIFNTLHKGNEKFSTSPKGQKLLGFCNSKDFDDIKTGIEKTLELRKLYGENWSKYNNEE
ncbi:hypothetical protein H1R17_11825 [Flavobacterium sp. xlx-214]|uniref:hypothetical protein n=1 Tax=unclassified Flavobacterium TaxID=196869 RepID=UPI0013D446F3|nr:MULTISPECIES: hypothetical protein [unclassified Flavobacterium]MBA5794047.1 hypothetical protein [Flavobacterium sp. xlx-221]QMI83138.1 hypothetical protein H1R17_11825 [Flavobacterium sp. xlx-214]